MTSATINTTNTTIVNTMIINTIQTPAGPLTLTERNGCITHCLFTPHQATESPLTKGTIQGKNTSPILRTAKRQFDEYFAGQRIEFDLPLAPAGTPFQQRVWAALQTIPYGETWSYQQLARHTGKPNACRAVGTANAKNPVGIIIPCHRVILASGKPGSYAGGNDLKVKLLRFEQEGVSIAAA